MGTLWAGWKTTGEKAFNKVQSTDLGKLGWCNGSAQWKRKARVWKFVKKYIKDAAAAFEFPSLAWRRSESQKVSCILASSKMSSRRNKEQTEKYRKESEMTDTFIYMVAHLDQKRINGVMNALESWSAVKLVFLRKPDGAGDESTEGTRSYCLDVFDCDVVYVGFGSAFGS